MFDDFKIVILLLKNPYVRLFLLIVLSIVLLGALSELYSLCSQISELILMEKALQQELQDLNLKKELLDSFIHHHKANQNANQIANKAKNDRAFLLKMIWDLWPVVAATILSHTKPK